MREPCSFLPTFFGFLSANLPWWGGLQPANPSEARTLLPPLSPRCKGRRQSCSAAPCFVFSPETSSQLIDSSSEHCGIGLRPVHPSAARTLLPPRIRSRPARQVSQSIPPRRRRGMSSLRKPIRNSLIVRRSMSSVLALPSSATYVSLRSSRISAVSAVLGFDFRSRLLRLFLRASASPRQDPACKP